MTFLIGTDCPFGPSEIVKHGESGFLVPLRDISAFTSALQKLLRDDSLMKKLSSNAGPFVYGFHRLEILKKYEEVLLEAEI